MRDTRNFKNKYSSFCFADAELVIGARRISGYVTFQSNDLHPLKNIASFWRFKNIANPLLGWELRLNSMSMSWSAHRKQLRDAAENSIYPCLSNFWWLYYKYKIMLMRCTTRITHNKFQKGKHRSIFIELVHVRDQHVEYKSIQNANLMKHCTYALNILATQPDDNINRFNYEYYNLTFYGSCLMND